MKDRYQELAVPSAWPRPAIALRIGLRGYGLADLRADLLAACVVGVVALPLSMALAIASGVPPQYGLYTAIVAGFAIALLGGSPVQVSGPTAAFVEHVVRSIRTAPHSDVVVLLTCLTLTVLFDMVVAVTVGVVMAALLFMRRMADVSSGRLTTEEHHGPHEPLPPGVLVYEIAGPLFFGAAQKAMGALQRWEKGVKVVVLDLRSVPMIDATGLVNLSSTIARLRGQKVSVVLAGVQPAPLRTLARAGLRNEEGLAIGKSFSQSLERARAMASGESVTRAGITR